MHSGTLLKTFAVAALAATTLSGAVGVARAADVVKIKPTAAQPIVASHTWDLLFGVTVASQYITRGLAQSTGAAVQPWAELDVGPVYLGYWGSNVSPSLVGGGTGHTAGIDGATWEHDLSVGFRPMVGPLTFDVGYIRYVYNNGDCCGEIYGKASINPVEPLTLGAAIYHNPDADTTYVEGNAKLALHSGFSISGAVGSQDGVTSWNAGASWAPHDFLTFDARYYGGPSGGGANKFVVSVAFATSLKKVSGGKY